MPQLAVTPPDTLIKYEAPLFAGLETSQQRPIGGKADGKTAKLEDMINSMLPPRYGLFFKLICIVQV